jgi:hypothetical protein
MVIFTAIWVPSIFGFGIYFKLAALLGENKMIPIDLLVYGIFVFVMLLIGLGLTVTEFPNMNEMKPRHDVRESSRAVWEKFQVAPQRVIRQNSILPK